MNPEKPSVRAPQKKHAHTAAGREIIGFWGWFERAALVVAVLSAGWALAVYISEKDDRNATAQARAWALLTSQALGNSGKNAALEYLNNSSVSFLVLICPAQPWVVIGTKKGTNAVLSQTSVMAKQMMAVAHHLLTITSLNSRLFICQR